MNAETKIDVPTEAADVRHIALAVPLDEFMRLKPFVSPEPWRRYLGGVHFERGEGDAVLLVATDGHRLGVFRSERALVNGAGTVRLPPMKPKLDKLDRKNRQWLVVGEFAGEALALIVSKPPLADATFVASTAALKDAHVIYGDPLVDTEKKFPDWRQVVPSKVGRKTASFNAAYLADFVAASGQKSTSVTLYGDNDSEPHLVDIGSRDFIGVLMPMRADEIRALPEWLTQPRLTEAKPKRKKAA